jgi:MFS family permease
LKSYTKNFTAGVLATVFFVSTYYFLMPVLPVYMQENGLSNFLIGLTMGAFSISSLFARPLSGEWADRLGYRRVMLASVGIYLVTPLGYLAGASFWMVSILQLFYGFSVGAFTVASVAYITDISGQGKVTQSISLHSIAIIIAKGLAPSIGYKVFTLWGLQGALGVSFVSGLIGGLFVYFLDEPDRAKQTTTKTPYITAFKEKSIVLPTVVLFLGLITFGAVSTMLPLFAKARNIEGVSTFFFINTLCMVLVRFIASRIDDRHLPDLILSCIAVLSASMIIMSRVHSFKMLVVAAVIYGLGYGGLYPAMSALVVLTVKPELRGRALGIYTAAFDLGVASGATIGGLSQFIDFGLVYLLTAAFPVTGFILFYRHLSVFDKVRNLGKTA